jgi:hypothetical protein
MHETMVTKSQFEMVNIFVIKTKEYANGIFRFQILEPQTIGTNEKAQKRIMLVIIR